MNLTRNQLETLDTTKSQLPANYEAARKALESTARIDECKDWADKAAALASYARQANDRKLEKLAMRIKVRAVRRIGILLEEIKRPPKGGRPRKNKDGTGPVSRKAAADEAGLSERQRKTALRMAKVPEADFEDQVESDEPPTVTHLTKPKKKDPDEEDIRRVYGDAPFEDPTAFSKAIHLGGAILALLERFEDSPPIKRMVDTMTDRAKQRLRGNLADLAEPMAELSKLLEK